MIVSLSGKFSLMPIFNHRATGTDVALETRVSRRPVIREATVPRMRLAYTLSAQRVIYKDGYKRMWLLIPTILLFRALGSFKDIFIEGVSFTSLGDKYVPILDIPMIDLNGHIYVKQNKTTNLRLCNTKW